MSTSGDSQPYLNDFMMRDDEDGVSGGKFTVFAHN